MSSSTNIEEIYPLSPMQQGMLFHSLQAPETGVYFEQSSWVFHGDLNVAAFERAWHRVLLQYPVLRTAFMWEDLDEPLQVVHKKVDLSIHVHDWRSLPEAEQDRNLETFLQTDRTRGFDLSQAPLMRSALLRTADEAYRFVWSHHHLLLDGWSAPLVLQTFFTSYKAFCEGREPALPPTRPYRDYIAWLKRNDLREAEHFWRKTLEGFIAPTPVPAGDEAGPEGDYHEVEVELREISGRLNDLVRKQGITLSTLLQGAWAIVLGMYSGEEDVVFGSTVSGRPADLPGAETMVGLFINTLPVRVNLRPDRTVLSTLRELMAQQAESRQYEYCSLVDIQGWSRVDRRLPLFESIFVFENYPIDNALQEGVQEGNLRIQGLRSTDKTNYPLTVSAGPGREIFLSIAYDGGRFASATIAGMAGRIRLLLESIAERPDRLLSELPLLLKAERRSMLLEWNDTAREYPRGPCIHRLFEAQAALVPDSLAVVVPSPGPAQYHAVTYRELNHRANQLARHLQGLGVGPDTVVGLCMEHSPDLIVGVLGTLKAGGSYLAMDPSYPADRLSLMIEESGVQVIITQEKLRGRCRGKRSEVGGQRSDGIEGRVTRDEGREEKTEVGGPRSEVGDRQLPPTSNLQPPTIHLPPTILCLDSDWDKIAGGSGENLPDAAGPENLAYVVYTSGSTGRPKGVMVRHCSLVNACFAWQESYDLHAGTTHLQMANPSFDVFSGDVVRALCSGGTLVLCPRDFLLEPERLYDLMAGQRVECAEFVPAVLRILLEHLRDTGQDLRFMRLLICGSDVWNVKEYESIFPLISLDTRLINSFGVAEATIDSTYFEARSLTLPGDRMVPIGRPFANTRVYISDRDLRPRPPGVPGELLIAGAGVSRGYLGRPEWTGERFVPDPFSSEPGACLYRTGDLARFLPDGTVEFLGRVDRQVKIHGVRIELEEIEAALNEHPSVRHGVVAAFADESGGKFLSAYVVVRGKTVSEGELRGFLKERLPGHMVPLAYTTLDELPLTPSGKVDRKGLPAPEGVRSGSGLGYVPPRTAVERVLCDLWAQVLGVERVGVRDNFYDLGGHSLKATQLISRVQKVFETELRLRDLFETLTVAGLAARLEAGLKASSGIQTPPLQPIPRDRDLPLSFSQQRLWFLEQLAPGNLFYNIPMALRLKGRLQVTSFVEALNRLIERHEALRTCFSQAGGRPVQVIRKEMKLTLPIEDLSQEPDREVKARKAVVEEAQKPFDLIKGPLLRGRLLKLGEDEHVFVLVIHHIVSDGWSTGVMVQELALFYEAHARNRPVSLPDLPIQYADFAHWQRKWLQGEVLEGQLAYWREQLKGIPPMLEIPTDRGRQVIQGRKGGMHNFELPKGLAGSIRRLSRENDVTTFMTLLSAFQVLLYRYTGQADFCIGMPIANRNREEIEGLIGFFVNTLVLRADLSGGPAFEEVLGRVRRTAMDAYTHQDVPFELLVDALQPERDLSHTPLFQVMFTMDPPLTGEVDLAELTLGYEEVDWGSSVFDLTLCMIENPDALGGYFEYDPDLFDEATIERMAAHYERILERMVSTPDESIDRVDILSEAEKRETLLEWNAAYLETPADRCVHELFRDRAEERPDSIGLIFEDQTLTYGELNRRANRLSHYLMKLGVGPEVLVGICTERRPEMIVGILGVLKAGGAYLPLDPAYPPERLRFMVEDSGVGVILTQEKLRGECSVFSVQGSEVGDQRSEIRGQKPEVGGQRSEIGGPRSEVGDQELPPTSNLQPPTILCLDSDWPRIAQEPDDDPPVTATPRNLAYVIYTSGSTGRPKGAMLSHAGLCNLTAAQRQAFGIDGESRVLQFSPLSFDASVWETFMALANGAALCLGRQEVLASGLELARLMEEKRVTHATLPPSVVRVLPREDLPGLRTVIAAGEACTAELVERWAPGRDFYNAYGPTETTVCASMKLCCGEDGPPPIGRPIANTRLYVLDGNLEAVPVGVPGELCVGGVSVARGYLNRPDLSAEKFIPDPFVVISNFKFQISDSISTSAFGERLYRTGDLVKYLSNGDIQFLGRIDQQVKVRGFRIELGEVDEALHRVKGVKEGVVVAHDDRLVAYVIPEGTEDPPGDEIREAMREMLPEYMVPSLFVYLDHLPMTPSGKVDRKGLPAPDRTRRSERGYAPPTNPMEQTLALLYGELLGLERVGIHDHFFELGGHSLLATQLVSRIREDLGVEIPLRTVFEHPNVAELALWVGASEVQAKESPSPISPLKREAHRVRRSQLAQQGVNQ